MKGAKANAFGFVLIAIFGVLLSGCSSRYLNADVSEMNGYFCYLDHSECGFGDNVEFISYLVIPEDDGRYRVMGTVNVEMMTTGNQDWVDFWLLLMDEKKVVGEHYIKTIGGKYSFDVMIDTLSEPTRTTITNVKFWTRT